MLLQAEDVKVSEALDAAGHSALAALRQAVTRHPACVPVLAEALGSGQLLERLVRCAVYASRHPELAMQGMQLIKMLAGVFTGTTASNLPLQLPASVSTAVKAQLVQAAALWVEAHKQHGSGKLGLSTAVQAVSIANALCQEPLSVVQLQQCGLKELHSLLPLVGSAKLHKEWLQILDSWAHAPASVHHKCSCSCTSHLNSTCGTSQAPAGLSSVALIDHASDLAYHCLHHLLERTARHPALSDRQCMCGMLQQSSTCMWSSHARLVPVARYATCCIAWQSLCSMMGCQNSACGSAADTGHVAFRPGLCSSARRSAAPPGRSTPCTARWRSSCWPTARWAGHWGTAGASHPPLCPAVRQR